MELYGDKKKCCGCGACYNKCPKGAITMKEDEYGFVYPEINNDICINCGLCKKSCSYQKEKELNKPIECYAACSNDYDVKSQSASGGIFAQISKSIINRQGVVYGVSMESDDDYLRVEHIRISTINDLYKLQGSKYVQSNMKDVFKQVKDDINNGKLVLFSGTPCQIDSLRSFLDYNEYDNLFFIDIICHGVPNNKMFNDYIKCINKKEKIRISNFRFRNKKKGWGSYYYSYEFFKKGKVSKKIRPAYESSFYSYFLGSSIIRENCCECPYACMERPGDVTIGDYWGILREHGKQLKEKKLDVNQGISCVLVNSAKGKKMLKEFGNSIEFIPSSFEKISRYNEPLNSSVHNSNVRKDILDEYKEKGYESIDNRFNMNMKKHFLKNFLRKIYHSLPWYFRSIIKK